MSGKTPENVRLVTFFGKKSRVSVLDCKNVSKFGLRGWFDMVRCLFFTATRLLL